MNNGKTSNNFEQNFEGYGKVQQHVTPTTMRKLPPLNHTAILPPSLPPVPNTRYKYLRTVKQAPKKVRWNEKELCKSEDFVDVKKSGQGNKQDIKAVKALIQDVSGNIEIVSEIPRINEVKEDNAHEWLGIIENQQNFQEARLKERERSVEMNKFISFDRSQKEPIVKPARKRQTAAETAHLVVSSQIPGTSKEEVTGGGKEKEQEKTFQEPFWKLGDVPVKPVTLPRIEDIENEMKIIESEMAALLRPEEKYLRRSVAFTIGKTEPARSQTPGCVPQRLMKHQKAQVDRLKLAEKQEEAERRRSKSIAKRVQSARRKSFDVKVVPAKLEDERQQHEKEIRKKVEAKLKEATHRRNDILSKKVHAAKKQARTEMVNDRERETVDDHKSKQELKMNKISANKERMARRKLRSLKLQEKKRELARKKLAREMQEHEERCNAIVETETYDGDEDLGEHDWD